jgi:hypothetical protein
MHGQSGGPVIDEHGFVVGLVKGSATMQDPPVEVLSTAQNRSLAIAGNRIAAFLDRLKIAFRRSPSVGPTSEPRPNLSPAGIIGLVECW